MEDAIWGCAYTCLRVVTDGGKRGMEAGGPRWGIQGRSPRWMQSPGQEAGWGVQGRSPRWMGSQGRSPEWGVQGKEPQMGSPEPWALVLAPTVTSLGSCVKWLPGAGALLSFPALKFENVVSPPEGGWSLISASCWLPWLWLPQCLSPTLPVLEPLLL